MKSSKRLLLNTSLNLRELTKYRKEEKMLLSYDLFDSLLEAEMDDWVYGGDVTQHLFYYYNNEVLDQTLLNTIRDEWHEEQLIDLEEDELHDLLDNKEDLIKYLVEETIIDSKDDIDEDSLFISTENPGRIAWKNK